MITVETKQGINFQMPISPSLFTNKRSVKQKILISATWSSTFFKDFVKI